MVFVAADRRPRLFLAAEVDVGGENIVRAVILAVTAGVYHVAVELKHLQVGDDIRVTFHAGAFGCLQVVPEHRPRKPALTRGADNPDVGKIPIVGEVVGNGELLFIQPTNAGLAVAAIADSFQSVLFEVKAAGDDAAVIISVFIPPHNSAGGTASFAFNTDCTDVVAAFYSANPVSTVSVEPRDSSGIAAADGFDCAGIVTVADAAVVVLANNTAGTDYQKISAGYTAAGNSTCVVAIADVAFGVVPHDAAGVNNGHIARNGLAADTARIVAIADGAVVAPSDAAGADVLAVAGNGNIASVAAIADGTVVYASNAAGVRKLTGTDGNIAFVGASFNGSSVIPHDAAGVGVFEPCGIAINFAFNGQILYHAASTDIAEQACECAVVIYVQPAYRMPGSVKGAGEGMVFVAADRRPRLFLAAEVDIGGEHIVRAEVVLHGLELVCV